MPASRKGPPYATATEWKRAEKRQAKAKLQLEKFRKDMEGKQLTEIGKIVLKSLERCAADLAFNLQEVRSAPVRARKSKSKKGIK